MRLRSGYRPPCVTPNTRRNRMNETRRNATYHSRETVQTTGARAPDDCLDDHSRLLFSGGVLDEGAVDLEAIDRQLLHMDEGAIPCAEIIERNRDALGTQLLQFADDYFGIATDNGRLSYFDLNKRCRDSVLQQTLQEIIRIGTAQQFHGRCVQGNSPESHTLAYPIADVAENSQLHLPPEFGGQLNIVECVRNGQRKLDAPGRMPPPQKCFEANDFS